MSKTWQLQEAKNKLSEVVDRAIEEGPQRISRRGKQAAVVLSAKDYERLRGKTGTLAEFLKASPLNGLDLERAKDLPRAVEL